MTAARTAQPWDRPSKPWACPGGTLVTSNGVDRGTWLAERRTMIGASDVANLFGIGYGDEWTLWADKTGRAPDAPATAVMDRGNIFEDAVIELWATHYADFPIEMRRAGLMRSRRWEHAGATVDRLSICEQGRCVVEVKTQVDTSEWFDENGEDEVPTKFQMQGQWQLLATGRDHVHFVPMGPRFLPLHRVMMRDDELIETMLARAIPWWAEHVDDDQPPTATAAASAAVKAMFGNPNVGMKYVLTDDDAALAHALVTLKADADASKVEYANNLTALQARVGNATEVVWPDGQPYASWKPIRTVDGADTKWRKANPELAAAYSIPAEAVDAKRLAAEHPELLERGELRFRRNWKPA